MLYRFRKIVECSSSSCSYSKTKVGDIITFSLIGDGEKDINWAFKRARNENACDIVCECKMMPVETNE